MAMSYEKSGGGKLSPTSISGDSWWHWLRTAPDSRTPLRSASRADSDAAVERERDTRAAKKSKKGKKERNPKRSGDVADGEVTRATAELPQQARPDAATTSPTSQVLVEKREGAVHTSQQKVKVVSLLANSDVS
jgi:hypothetical protein